jgi:cellulose synthase (UDP-forming)
MSPLQPRARQSLFALYVVVSVAYLIWRALFTLNPDAIAYAWAFLGLETWATLCSMAFYATILERRVRPPPLPLPGVRVDVFVCSYNESLSLVRQTLRRAQAMDYPHQTWLLDDGRRPEARALAAELGCGYITRERNEHFKAGNLNNALQHTSGELIVVLDADHLVRPEFLTRLIGYFRDPEVALVQSPQVFYNLDSFQHHFQPRHRRMWHEGAIFHHAMQTGADRWNAAFFVGTGAIVRRSAVERIGGFATGSVTEDAFTCMRLHGAGYQSVYHDEPLAYLIAPESLHQYLTQRLRWGQGSMQILRMENPLWRPGLSIRQRLVYFMALGSFAQAIVHLAYYLAPPIFLLGGPAPLRAETPLQLLPIVLHVIFDVAVFKWFLGPLARPLLAECYKFINVYAYLKALSGLLSSRQLKFQVTTKGRDAGASVKLLLPQLALLCLNLMAFGYGTIRLLLDAHSTAGALGTLVALGFSGLFVVVGAMAMLFAWERIASRVEYTFPDHIPVALADGGGTAFVVRANEAELHVLRHGATAARVGEQVRAALYLSDGAGPLELFGQLQAAQAVRMLPPAANGTGSTVLGEATLLTVRLDPLSRPAADRLFDRFALVAMPRVIDPLVRAWDGSVARPPEPSDAYYLPLQGHVL